MAESTTDIAFENWWRDNFTFLRELRFAHGLSDKQLAKVGWDAGLMLARAINIAPPPPPTRPA